MLWIFFFTVSQAKKSICICNGECHPLCATDKIDAPSSSYQINKSLLTSFKNEEEIELILYSNQKGFNFKIDSTYFNNKKTTIKALNDSQIIKLQIKTGFLPFYKTIEIKPNYKICLPSLIPLESSYSNKKKISEHISDAISSTVPISVGFLQFDRLGTSLKCTAIHKNGDFYFNENNDGNPQNFNCNTNDLTSESAHQCGISCYSDNDNLTLSYTFKGVQFALYGTENKWLGKFLIELNGEVIEEVNQNVNHGDTSIRRTLIYRSDVLPYKEYKVRLLPSKNDGNGHYEIYKLVYWPSANSKRINSTEFNEASTSWTKESDGIGGVRHYVQNGGVATLPLYCSKFWIYGMKGTDINDIEISYNDFTETINMRSFRQKDEGALLYESPDLTKFNIVLSIKATSSFLKLYCIYYEEPPIPLSVGLTQMTFDGSNNCVLRNGNVVDYNSKPDLKNLGCDYNNLDSPEAYQCGLVCTSQDGNYSYQFYGVKYAIFGHYDSNYGKFDVELDDIFITEVDESIKNQKYQLLYESDVFNFKQHTIKIISKNQMYSLYKIVYWPSIKAIRMNSSQIKGDSTGWTSETDGIGGVQEYKGGTFTMQLTCTKFWFYGVTNTHLNQVTMTSSDGISATLNQRGPRNSGVMMYESPELEYATRQLTFSVSKQPIMIYTIYYEQELPKETPIPISIGFLDLERTGSFRCGGNHLSGDADFSMSNNQLNHTSNFNCSVNDFYSVYAYQCGIRCYTSSGDYSYTFTGVKFNIYGTKADGNHEFDVELDGAIIATPNEYQKQREAYTIVYQSDVLVYKEHTVRIIHKTKQYEIYKLTYWPSVNAVRMNSTSFVKVGTWINESDGVGGLREYTNTQGDTFSTNFTSSKFWIIGTVASHLNGFKLSVNQVESDVSQKVSNRKDSTIVYQSDETSYDYTLITGTSKGVFVVAGIFYQTRPSPFEYIDRTFTTTLPYFQILVKKSQIKQISGCSFIDISEDFDYFITLEQEVLFNDNLFQCDAQGTNKPAPINIRYNGKLTLRNCTFNNSRSRTNSGGNVLYCNTEFSIEVYFISCNFQNCGNSKDCAIIDIQNSNSKINLYKCDFIFDNSDVSSMAIKSNCIAANIDNCKFIKTCGISISRSTISDASQLSITKCSFDYCGSETMNFLDLSLGQPSSIVFENINISNMIRNEGQKFTMYLKADSNIQEMELRNISFTDNSCFSLFGGGVGICIEKVNTLSFYDCTFIRNKAGSDDSNRNDMLSDIEPNYHAGDGGGIQIGFLRNLKESAVKFEQCLFKNNKAIRHGGALAIQTTSTVEIIGCTFESNEANSNIASSNLLWENHFNKKTQGRGGAIYINPSFSYTSSSSSSDIDFSMTSLTIRDCTFSKNLAIDGYAIYIEGDDPGTTFGFQNNNFNNNFNIDPDNDPNITERGVIATEIHSIVKEDVLNDNHFSHDELSSIPKEFVYVDHYGNIMPTQGFSESVPFSKTEQFSLTNDFTKSKDFSKSEQFSQSSQFSQSNPFSQSQQFSNPFSETGHFSKTEQFSLTNDFTKSNDFSNSKQFSSSNQFSQSKEFSHSNPFSETGHFSKTEQFSLTNDFTKSNDFSNSKQFSSSNQFSQSKEFSHSNPFSETGHFSKTEQFSLTNDFTKSNDFSYSKQFSSSNQFSQSKEFSHSNPFSETGHFSKTEQFSLTNDFTKSNDFSNSKQFSSSNQFSQSKEFSHSNPFSETGHFSKTEQFSLTNDFTKSNDFSNSKQFSSSNQFSQSKEFSHSNPFSETGHFSKTEQFSLTNDFTKSNDFSYSKQFSSSNQFSQSKEFSHSNPFSETGHFSKTEQFSLTNDFTKSNDFSNSKQFSSSNQFSQSKEFSHSNPFSETGHFSKTEQFSLTTVFTKSNDFSDSNYFTKSNKFTVSNCFTNSNEFSRTGKFSSSKAFSMTIYFSESTKFSQSLHFTLSDTFSRSQMFSKSGHFSETNYFSQTDKFSFTLLFSKSEDLTLSSLFSLSKQFSHSRHFSNTKQFTETNHFTLTDKFTQTKHFTESQQFTKSNAFSLSSTFSLSKKFTTSGHFTLSNGFSNTNKFSSSYGFSESFAFTPSASLIPDNPLCSIIDEFGNMTLSNRCEYEGSEDHKVTVEITRSNFTDFHENEDGGAIRVKNCEVRCNGTLFLNCSSGIGGGGGIYINNTINTEINIDLINLTFIQCHAIYGGAVFIRSIHESSKILVYNCSFDSNRALGKKSIDSLYGGSALFLATRGVNLNYSTFSHSKGQGGAIRIEDCYYGLDFESKFNKRIKLSDEENMKTFSISDCYFEEEDDDSTNSILDATGNEGKEIELINCIFKGKSANEKKYINDDTKHKFHIISCSFDNDTNAVRNYIDVDVNKKPVYDIHKQVKRNSYISIIAALAISMSILVLTLIKIMKSNNNDNSYDDSYDPYE